MSAKRRPKQADKTVRHKPKAASANKRAKSTKGAAKRPKRKTRTDRRDPSDTDDAEVRFVQPYQATKSYLCPGCNRDITPGTGHMVVVPPDAPDLRRHWHRGCWANRASRR
jgi:hypothetical protein